MTQEKRLLYRMLFQIITWDKKYPKQQNYIISQAFKDEGQDKVNEYIYIMRNQCDGDWCHFINTVGDNAMNKLIDFCNK